MAFPERGDIKFLQVLELEIKKNDAADVMRQELLDDTAFKASILHPFGNLAGRPAAYLAFVKLCNCPVEGAERASLWGLWSSTTKSLGSSVHICQWLDCRRHCERHVRICGVLVR
jgi:hypothetical protein